MIIDHSPTPLESLNPLDAIAFGIEINEFTFDLLIKKLYSNPIKSIVRELVSNAWDSHTAAGQTHVAVTVNAPTLFDPYFTVQDYGTGLSHEDMTTLYSTICRSDRRDSNSFLGGFGLGSKSPYSYTDQFTVESRYNGWKRLYAVYKNTDNIPTLSLMSTTATDEHNGLTVKIPVKSVDQYKFGTAIQEELLFFPRINTNIDIIKPTVLWASDDDQIIVTKTSNYFNGFLYAVVGNVIYRVPTNQLFNNNDGIYNQDYSWKGNLFIRCEIGKLSIVPNREDLQYNDTTVNYLEAKVSKAKETLQEHIRTTIPLCPTYNSACKQFGPLRVALSSMRWWNDNFTHPERPGEPISSYVAIPLGEDVDAAITTQGRRRRSNGTCRIDHWVGKDHIKLNMDTKYELLWCPKKTPYLAERLRQVSNTDRQCIVLRGGNQDELVARFNNELLIPVTTRDLSHYQADSHSTGKRTATQRLINGDTIHNNILDATHDSFVRMDGNLAVYNEKTYTPSEIMLGKNALDSFLETRGYRYIIQIPKSRWNCKLTKEFPEALPLILKNLTQLIGLYTDEIKDALVLNQVPNRYDLINMADTYRHDLRCSPFFNGLQHYRSTPTKITNLIHAATALGLPLPTVNPARVETTKAFYEQYRPFIDYHIDCNTHPQLIAAYETYLEQLNNV